MIAGKHLGWWPDGKDHRDRDFELLGVATTPPTRDTVRHLALPAPDQLITNSCVGQALRQAYYIEERKRRFKPAPLPTSALGHYFNARAVDGVELWDTGARIRSAIKALKYHGALRESYWPFSTLRVNQRPTPLAYRSGYPTRGDHHYYSITSSGNQRLIDIKRAIADGHGVMFGTPVTKAMTDFDGPLTVPKPNSNDKIEGGHSMCIVEYEPGRMLSVGSYGNLYRDHGCVWMTDEYMAWEETHDFWVLAL